jgi:hypothetical protein
VARVLIRDRDQVHADGHAARLRSGKRVPNSRSGYERLRTMV